MRTPLWQVDAFADRVFKGNPAAVCLLDLWPNDELLRSIAQENNLAETAFLVKEQRGLRIRWFTPEVEVDLCGHATLASASVYFTHLEPLAKEVTFDSRSGKLRVVREEGGLYAMNFPRRPPAPCETPEGVLRALGRAPLETRFARDYLAVLPSEAEVRELEVDLQAVKSLPGHGLMVTAVASTPGLDFVSRYFAPQVGIPEDPVTGSAHCVLVPFWAGRLGKSTLEAAQVSRRGGRLHCADEGETVRIAGRAVEYLQGAIEVPGL